MSKLEPIGNRSEPERTRPFEPKDNAVPLDTVDWKSRYNELKNNRDWDPEKQFVGLKRLGDSYHPLDAFFKFDGVPEENATFDKVWVPTLGGFGGLVCGAVANYWGKRPLFSSLPTTLVTGLLGFGLTMWGMENGRRRARERDAVLIHYLILHEQDFPRIERKRFGQIVRPWNPIRLGQDGLFLKD